MKVHIIQNIARNREKNVFVLWCVFRFKLYLHDAYIQDAAFVSHLPRREPRLGLGVHIPSCPPIMASLKEAIEAPSTNIDGHTHCLVFLYENPRTPEVDEDGTAWIQDANAHRAGLLAAETAVVLSNYLRVLGYDSRGHTVSSSDVDLNKLAVNAGLLTLEHGELKHPYIGSRFGLAAVTTNFAIEPDKPLASMSEQPKSAFGAVWKYGTSSIKNATNSVPYSNRRFVDGAHPFEKLKRVDIPTTYIDEPNIPRVPKRTDLFTRAKFGDLGKKESAGCVQKWPLCNQIRTFNGSAKAVRRICPFTGWRGSKKAQTS